MQLQLPHINLPSASSITDAELDVTREVLRKQHIAARDAVLILRATPVCENDSVNYHIQAAIDTLTEILNLGDPK